MRKGAAAAAVLGGLLMPSVAFSDLQGRYLGSYQLVDGLTVDDSMRHLLDLHTQDDLSSALQLRLDASLVYRYRPGTSATDLFQSRFFANLRSPRWRAYAQFVPWQDAAPGVESPRRREIQLGLDMTPRRGPALRFNYDRHDRETFLGRSSSDSYRAGASYFLDAVGSHLDYRRIETRSEGGLAAPSTTDEWKAGVGGTRSWHNLYGTAGYEAEMTTFDSRERERRYYTQRVDLNGHWRPHRKVRMGGSAFTRWGKSEDNARGDQPIDEDHLGASVGYQPIRELDLEAIRDYRSTRGFEGNTISDYFRFQAILRKELRRNLLFQNGYSYTADLASDGGSVPRNSIYFLLDGRVRRGVGLRGELRFASDPGDARSEGLFVRRLLGVRLAPSRTTRAEVTWSLDTFPELVVPAEVDSLPDTRLESQSDRLWDILLGYQPSSATDFSVSYRDLDGSGRSDRDDRYTSATGSLRFAQRSSLGLTWSHRLTRFSSRETADDAVTVDLSFWFPRDFRTKLTWTHNDAPTRPATDFYNVTLEKNF